MQFIAIELAYQKEITGVSSNYQLEFNKKSFEYDSDEKIFKEFFKSNSKEFSRNLLESFISFPQEKLTGTITLFPTGKRLKKIDFFRTSPFYMGILAVISQKVLDIFSKYRLPNLNKIKVKIDGFSDNYYLIGLPILSQEKIDYKNSKFVNIESGKTIIYNTFDNFKNREDKFNIFSKEIYLLEEYDYDMLYTAGAYDLCLIPEIIKELNQEQCIGFHEVEQDHLVVISP